MAKGKLAARSGVTVKKSKVSSSSGKRAVVRRATSRVRTKTAASKAISR